MHRLFVDAREENLAVADGFAYPLLTALETPGYCGTLFENGSVRQNTFTENHAALALRPRCIPETVGYNQKVLKNRTGNVRGEVRK
jgi:hypothetical protein